MKTLINRQVQSFLQKYAESEDRVRFQDYFSMYTILASAAIAHTLYVLFFLFIKVPYAAALGFVMTFLFVTSMFMVKKGFYSIVAVSAPIAEAIYILVMIYHIGNNSNLQLFIIASALPCFLFFKIKSKTTAIVTIILFILFILSVYVGFVRTPKYSLDTNVFFTMLNSCIAFAFIIFELLINNIFKGVIVQMNADKIELYKMQAYNDSMTSLKNRRFAEIYFERLVAEGDENTKACFAMADIDFFKHVNDTYGHDAGDTVLKSLADYMSSRFRSTDLVCRWGGEEFLIVLKDVEYKKGCEILDEMRMKIKNMPVKHGNLSINFTISLGAAYYTHGKSIHELITECDVNLYKSKGNGRDRLTWS